MLITLKLFWSVKHLIKTFFFHIIYMCICIYIYMYKTSLFENFCFRILYKSDDLISDSPEQITIGSINL